MPDTRGYGPPDADLTTASVVDEPSPPRRRWPLVVAAVLGVLVVAYVAAALLLGSKIPADTTVAGIDIGGMDAAAATGTLERELAPRADEPVSVSAGESTEEIVPSAAGVGVDVAGTVDAAGPGSRWNPAHLITVLTGGGEVEPVLTVDETALAAAVDDLAAAANVEPSDGSISFADGSVEVVQPVDGIVVDTDGATEVLATHLLDGTALELPVETTPPAVGSDELDRAVQDFAEPAMSAPVVITAGETRVELSPAEVGPHLTMTPDDGGVLQPEVDAAGLIAALPERFAPLVKPPANAYYTFEADRPKLVPGVDGTAVDADTLATGLLAALPAAGDARVAEATVAAQPPEITTEYLESIGIEEVISEFTTEYPIAPYRLTNIGRAAELINGTLLLPGDTFSLNETVGERTAANGFVEGTVIQDGQFFKDFGGGVSQVATTNFNAMFFAGLQDIEHKPHSFYISRYPAGREATVAWPSLDMSFRNDSETGVLMQEIHTPGQLTVRFWGTKHWDEIQSVSSERYNIVGYDTVTQTGDDCIDQGGVQGFDITVTRNFVEAGEVVRSEDFQTHYNPADDITCS